MKTIVASGKTHPHKETLKANGFRWNAADKVWSCPVASDEVLHRLLAGLSTLDKVEAKVVDLPAPVSPAKLAAPSPKPASAFLGSLAELGEVEPERDEFAGASMGPSAHTLAVSARLKAARLKLAEALKEIEQLEAFLAA